MKLSYCSSPCGSRKTFSIVIRAVSMAKSGKIVLIAQPTTELIEKTVPDELGRFKESPVICGMGNSIKNRSHAVSSVVELTMPMTGWGADKIMELMFSLDRCLVV
jgi:hypothetical protein